MFKGIGDLGKLMQQAQDMQSKMAEMQDQLSELEVTGRSGGDLVSITLSAKGEMRGVQIDDSLMVAEDKEVLEDLIKAAYNDAKTKAEAAAAEEMAKITEGLPLPPGYKMPMG